MAKVKTTNPSSTPKPRRPAITPEGRENQLISLAMDVVEQRLRDGTASSQETTHFLKLGSTIERLKMSNLEEENKLLKAKTEMLQSQKRNEELMREAINAFKNYSGNGDSDEY